jgi:hypothetical protein
MAAWRRAIELSLGDADTANLRSIAQSRTEPASRVERARILLAYREDPSFFAVGRALGLHHQTVQRCVERAVAEGPLAALDDRPRPGREPTITLEAKAWLVSLACRKAKDLGYPHELWTTRLLAGHAREHGPAEGHACLANLAQVAIADSKFRAKDNSNGVVAIGGHQMVYDHTGGRIRINAEATEIIENVAAISDHQVALPAYVAINRHVIAKTSDAQKTGGVAGR